MLKALSISIIRTLRDHGHQAYLVGGCVRDILLGREPADYDVATDATPEQVMRIFPDAYGVGVQFGVVLVPAPPEMLPATNHTDVTYGRGCHIPLRHRLLRRPPSRRSPLQQGSAGRCATPRLHHQRHDARSGQQRSARLCRRPGGLEGQDHPLHWQAGPSLRRRQATHVTRGAVCGALRLRDRACNVCRHSRSWRPRFIRYRESGCATN